MTFHYYYIVQDIIGVLLIFIFGRILLLNIQFLRAMGLDKRRFRLFVYYLLFILSGINLCLGTFNVRVWVISIILFILGVFIKP